MNKVDLLKKLNALAMDSRGNENERRLAEERLNYLIKKYDIDPESINMENLVRRDIYFKDTWELKLIGQTIYKLMPGRGLYKAHNKKHWVFCEMTDAEYLEFEMYYCAYKAAFSNELELFIRAFIAKNDIYPKEIVETDNADKTELSRADKMKIAMMAQGIERANIRRLLNE